MLSAPSSPPAGSPWQHWRPATCMPDACFCEAVRDGWIRQPANTLSSLAFVVLAAAILAKGFGDRRTEAAAGGLPGDVARSPIHGTAGYPAALALAFALIGVGSAFYHASLTFIGQFVDLFGMYLVATFVVFYALGRTGRLRTTSALAGYLGANILLAGLLWVVPEARRWAFAVVLLAGLAVEHTVRRRAATGPGPEGDARFGRRAGTRLDRRLLARGMAALGVAFGIWTLDLTGVLCAPHSPLQGHAAWHLLGALAGWWLYAYYRSERPVGAID